MMKKNLLKKMSVVVAAAAIMVSALPISASAASYIDGKDYKATVNFYVPKAETPKNLFSAYLNDTNIPPMNKQSDNVDVDITKGVITFKLPIENTQFGIKKLVNSSDEVTTILQDAENIVCSNHTGVRYNTLSVTIDNGNSGQQNLSYQFENSNFHARISTTILGKYEITAYDGNFNAKPVLEIELPSSAIKQ